VIPPKNLTVLAAVAHPDDIEFYFSGTLLLLKKAGCSIHMWNLADGCCGTMQHSREEITRIRAAEAQASAQLAGAQIHRPLFSDLEIFYERSALLAVAAILRSIKPQIIFTHSPSDYMEDHQNVCRLIVTAAFSRAISNFMTTPPVSPYAEPVRIYHAPPHGLTDAVEVPFQPSLLIDVNSMMETKRQMLACHGSQQDWLARTQEMPAYVRAMEQACAEMGGLGDGLTYAEAWRRHSHVGFCPANFDPLPELLISFSQKPTP
jgi:N-acetylglucosamine malate deacetylase 1